MAAYHKLLVWDMVEQAVAHPDRRVAAEPADRQERGAVLQEAGGARCWLPDVPGVPGVLTPAQCRQTAQSIAATQESSGAIPWFDGGHTDPWDHVENAMALTAAGLLEPARAAFDWCRDHPAGRRLVADPAAQRRRRGRQQRQQLLRLHRHRCLAPRADHRRPPVRRGDVAGGQQGHRLRARPAGERRRNRLGQKPLRARAGCAADRMREHLPQHPLRAGAGGLLRRPAARVGGRRRPAGPRDRRITPSRSSPRTAGRWSGTTRCSAVRCAARRPARASTSGGTTSWCPASASAASTTGRGSPEPKPASW